VNSRKLFVNRAIVAIFLNLLYCNNYNLLQKMENPGGSFNSQEKFADRLFVFATSMTTQGNMQGLTAANCGGTGLAKADCVCQQLAIQNNRRRSSSSRFVAWLSNNLAEMRCRIIGSEALNCTPTGTFTWFNTNFDPVFVTLESATAGVLGTTLALSNAPKFNEMGGLLPTETDNIWTGTSEGGIIAGNRCSEWASNTNGFLGRSGQANMLGNAWTNSSDVGCDQFKRIYCFAVP
jgi:hypothetical protein